jgi:hypothetical protein
MNTTDHLTTKVPIQDFQPKILYKDALFMIGSCFAEHISDKLERYKYQILSNPFGILYNPVSIARSFKRIAKLELYHPEELVQQDGLYHSMDHHGSYSGKSKDEVILKINSAIKLAHDHLKKCKIVFISPGTSRVFRYSQSESIVGNCHKIPQSYFTCENLSLKQCEQAFETTIEAIRHIAPEAHIVWTVSPVRHIRDGLVENQRSKAALILGIESILRHHTNTSYFPAYEMMMDELRDYRFYARDLIHPSPVAVDIIWEKFCHTYLDPAELTFHNSIEKVKRAMAHRMLHDDSEAVKSFARGQLKQIDQLAALLPDLNWQPERQYFFHFLELD